MAKFTFYSHHSSKVSLTRDRKKGGAFKIFFYIFYYTGLAVLKFFRILYKTFYHISFTVGSIVWGAVKGTFSVAAKDAKHTRLMLSHRLRLLQALLFRQSMAIFLLCCLLGWGGFVAAKLVARALELKTSVMQSASLANQHLSAAEQALKGQNFDQANLQFAWALKNFNSTQTQIQSTGEILDNLLNVFPQKRDAEKLVTAGQIIAKTGQQMLAVTGTLKHFSFSPEGVSSSGDFGQDMNTITDSLKNISGNLAEVQKLIQGVDPGILPQQQAQKFISLKGRVQILNSTVNSLANIFGILKNIAVGQKNVLILFENNNELRPSGGFLGTYGNFTLDNGKIKNLKISSIYDLDGQLKENIVPPTPVLNVNNRWFLRDSNWFANFPDSAKKISQFYEKEGGETPDLVIVLTPSIISDWLKITGPVNMPEFGVTLDSGNFVERAQELSSVNNSPVNAPKQVLADFFPVLLQKIAALPPEDYGKTIQVLQANLASKQILLFSRDQNLQNQFSAYDWAGEILSNDRDSLSIVSSNLGGTKTDLYIDQKINLNTTISPDGSVQNELTITRTNTLPKMYGTENTSFLRVMVPKGSSLVSNTGFDYKNLDTNDLKNSQTDPDVYEWEKNSVRDTVTGTVIGQEAGESYFGNWLTVAGGESKTVKIVYTLPFSLNTLDHYSLLLQKQPGAKTSQFDQAVSFVGKKLDWKNFDETSLGASGISLSLQLNKDYFLGMVLEDRN